MALEKKPFGLGSRDLKIWDSSIYPSTKKSEGVINHPPIQICLILK